MTAENEALLRFARCLSYARVAGSAGIFRLRTYHTQLSYCLFAGLFAESTLAAAVVFFLHQGVSSLVLPFCQ